MKKLALLFFLISLHTNAQTINPTLLTKSWKAFWIQAEDLPSTEFGVYYYRKEIKLDQKPKNFIVHVSGDNRYKLFVNGTLVSLGPARSDLYHWNFETKDIAPYLNSGINTISSIVWSDGPFMPGAQITSKPGFILQGNSDLEKEVNTNASWKSIKADFYSPIKANVLGYYIATPGEFRDMNREFENWMLNGLDDSHWKKPNLLGPGYPKGANSGGANSWMLVQSQIPAMEQTLQRIIKLRATEGIKPPSDFPQKKQRVIIPAKTKAKLLLDQTFNTNAYAVLEYSKGKNASVSITYAESLYDKENMEKGNRNEIEGKKIIGVKDSIICNGKDNQSFTALNWRTFRYIELEIQTKEEALQIDDFYGIFTAYPFEKKSNFTSPNLQIDKIQEIGWRTARLCAMENYMDTPLYEQLQYVGDTRIQAMVSYYNTGDDRLARQAIRAIDNSKLSEGVTQSSYPSHVDNIIPPFSLMWIGMLNDYYHYRPDTTFVKEHLPGMRQILSFFDKFKKKDGTLFNLPYWCFVDWPENARGWKRGVPPLNEDGSSATLDLQLLWAYQWASELENALGNQGMGQTYSLSAKQLKESIIKKYWSEEKQLFANTETKNSFSQHANTLAILTQTVSAEQAQKVYTNMMTHDNITRASIYFRYYVNQALNKVGLGDNYLEKLDVWKEYVQLGMTTWGEDSYLATTRSDCHAWGSSPNIEFFRITLGIDSDAPGFSRVKIEPKLGDLFEVSGSIPHEKGDIKVSYKLTQNGKLNADITLPPGLPGKFNWKGKTQLLKPGLNAFTL